MKITELGLDCNKKSKNPSIADWKFYWKSIPNNPDKIILRSEAHKLSPEAKQFLSITKE